MRGARVPPPPPPSQERRRLRAPAKRFEGGQPSPLLSPSRLSSPLLDFINGRSLARRGRAAVNTRRPKNVVFFWACESNSRSVTAGAESGSRTSSGSAAAHGGQQRWRQTDRRFLSAPPLERPTRGCRRRRGALTGNATHTNTATGLRKNTHPPPPVCCFSLAFLRR